jgi:hypothetical protein
VTELSSYLAICEQIYHDWIRGDVDPGLEGFDVGHLPEPYLEFGQEGDPCIFLTTNPGAGMDVQLPAGLSQLIGGPLPEHYQTAARHMAQFYEHSGQLKGAPLANIRAMRGIAAALGYQRVLQVEMVPWHSPKFPDKRKTLERLRSVARYREYAEALGALLARSPVVLSWSGGDPERRSGDGMDFKAAPMGLDLARAHMFEISRTDRASQALLWSHDSRGLRGLFVNRAAANLPKQERKDKSDVYADLAREIFSAQ